MGPDPRAHRRLQRAVIALTAIALAITAGTILLTHLPPSDRQVGFACDRHSCWAVDPPPDRSGAVFTNGAIDLTGDGSAERVELVGGELRVLQRDVEIWRSDPTWQVVDVTLGDPNDDGRNEILAALWKANDAGEFVSHPYIIAHRGGTVKLIWGGSPVAYPILELELADVDNDGVQELVVLETTHSVTTRDTPLQTLSIWDWHGWGFNLRWRSEAGRYRSLGVARYPTGDVLLLTKQR